MTADQEAERKLIVALDMPDAGEAYDFWQRLAIPNAVCKIGLELLMAGGVELVRKLASSGVSVFVDAKLFDIANTVERATARVADLGAAFLTVHAQDRQALEAAVRGRAGSALKLLGITLLTNANPDDLSEQGITLSSRDLVLRRAGFAADAGFDGVVSSAWEARDLKANFGERLALVCPGIRLTAEKDYRRRPGAHRNARGRAASGRGLHRRWPADHPGARSVRRCARDHCGNGDRAARDARLRSGWPGARPAMTMHAR